MLCDVRFGSKTDMCSAPAIADIPWRRRYALTRASMSLLVSMTPINSRSVISHMSCWSRTSSLALELEEKPLNSRSLQMASHRTASSSSLMRRWSVRRDRGRGPSTQPWCSTGSRASGGINGCCPCPRVVADHHGAALGRFECSTNRPKSGPKLLAVSRVDGAATERNRLTGIRNVHCRHLTFSK